jgi:beta-glucosidase
MSDDSDSASVSGSGPVERTVADLLAQMTLEEKLAQLGSVWVFELLTGTEFDEAKARERLRHGIGQITRVAGATNLGPVDVAALANRIQRFLVDETRLGIPAIVHEECLHGFLARGAVCYPQSLGQAATWNPSLVRQMAERLGRQMRSAGAHQGLAPVLDVARDPRWGRIEETYGEDPYLVAEMGAAYVRGLQDEDHGTVRGVLATGKHLVGHGLPEGGLNHAPAHIGERELRDVFLTPFEAAVNGAGIRSMMHAYDDIDGVPCVASKLLLTDILRDEWGFDGLVVADYAGIEELITSHALVSDLSHAAARALNAGVDVELPSTAAYGAPLLTALEAGLVDEATIDRAVARGLREKLGLGLFESAQVDETRAPPDRDGDLALAREIARQSVVLLKNDGVLPLSTDLRRLAVIGPNADSARNLLGDYAHVVHIETLIEMRDRANDYNFPIPADLDVADELTGHETILDAVRRAAGTRIEVSYARGCGVLDGTDQEIARAADVCRWAEVALVVLGDRSGMVDGCTSGEARDRLDLGLPGRQAELVRALAETGTPLVLILVSGRPPAIPDEAAMASAVVHAWLPGEAGPSAVADVMFGAASPGGKLPLTVPRHVGQVPIYYAHKPSGGRSHWKEDYVEGSHLPLWPFGFGLSYTSFEIGGLRLERASLPIGGELAVSVTVRNTGGVAGDEVVQLYVRDLEATVTRPVLELRGFHRLSLAPGESRMVTFRLAAEQLAFTGLDGRPRVEPGRHLVLVGSSSVDLPCRAEFTVTGTPGPIERRTRYFTIVTEA